MVEEALRLDRVSVRQEGITLLDSFSMRLFKSEILGLIPVNAQGLDELVNLVKSNSPVHYGYVWLSEHLVNDYRRPRKPENPVFILDAKGSLIDTMSVAENVFVVRDRMKKFLINRRVLNEQFTRLSTEVGLEIDPEAEAGTLSFFERKAVELIKALVLGTRIVVIRDLSNAASPDDLKGLMRIVRFYREKKKQTFLYICNDSEEAFSWCDRCVLMENGRIIKTLYSEQMTPEFLSRFPQGFQRYVNPGSLADDSETGGSQNPVFQISRLSFRTIRDLSLSLSGGECLVLMDLDHTLHESLTELLKGRSADESVTLEGQPFSRGREKMAFLDENPVRTSLFRDMSYLDNLCFP
ncbi:MAG: sugar ABC transporter ATP-binding protein, partial [Spirochaetales bacterium]|nr:sugar ABC transporter ATP-binding protein [Spirochaetales bacterium]